MTVLFSILNSDVSPISLTSSVEKLYFSSGIYLYGNLAVGYLMFGEKHFIDIKSITFRRCDEIT